MDFDKEVTEKLNNIISEKKRLQKEFRSVVIKEETLRNYINRCAIFNESILFIIAALLSYKENEQFMPIIYKKIRDCSTYPPMYSEGNYIGIASNRNITEFIMSKSENIDRFLELGLGYEIYQKSASKITKYSHDDTRWIIKDYNFCDYEKDENKRNITFGFILNHYEIRNSYPATYSHYDFKDYDYVQRFIVHLFNLQIKNSGRQLTYDQMFKALNEFIELEQNKAKPKTRT